MIKKKPTLFRRAMIYFMIVWLGGIGLAPIYKAQAQELADTGNTSLYTSSNGSGQGSGGGGGKPVWDAIRTFLAGIFTTLKNSAIGKAIATLAEVAGTIGNILKILSKMFNKIFEFFGSVAKAIVASELFQFIFRAKATDQNIKVNYALNKMTSEAKAAAQDPTPSSHGQLCRKLIMYQTATTLEEQEQSVTAMIATMLQSMLRGPGESGDTIIFASRLMNDRCLNKFGSPVDGYPARCIDTETTVGPFKRTFVDADLYLHTMDGAITLEIPDIKTYTQKLGDKEVTYVVATPEGPNQRAFVAAMNFCANLVGPRPVPPYGDKRKTPEGLRNAAIFGQGLTMESPHDWQCAALVSHFTRANLKQQKAFVDDMNERCQMAIKSPTEDGMLTVKTIEEKFDGCKKGLSPYQASYLAHAACKSVDYYVQMIMKNGRYPKLREDALACTRAWNLWKKNLVDMQGMMVKAVQGQMKVKDIWAEMSSGMQGALPSENGTRYGYIMKDLMNTPESKGVHIVNSILSIKPPPKQKVLVNGAPLSADEVALPQAVDQ